MSCRWKPSLGYSSPYCTDGSSAVGVSSHFALAPAGMLLFTFSLAPISAAFAGVIVKLPIEVEASTGLRAFYDGQDASSYLVLGAEHPSFELPFPQHSGTFQLRVEAIESGEALLDESFRVVSDTLVSASATEPQLAAEPVDKERAFNWSGQLDLSAQRDALDGSEYETRESESQRDSDVLAGFGFSSRSAAIESSVDLEFVHRKDRDNTLRLDGPKADMSRLVSTFTYGGKRGSSLSLTAGDIGLSSANSLVNTGMNSRGVALAYESPGQRLRLEVGRLYGQDIVGLEGGALGYASDSYRMAANGSLKLLSSDSVDWDMNVSVLDVDRGIEEQFGVSASQSGEVNLVQGVGSSLSLWQERLTLSLSWADSKYDNPEEQNAENLPEGDGFEVFDPGVTRGSAHRHSAVWRAVQTENTDISVEYNQEQASTFYRSVQGQATADRRERSLYSYIISGPVSASLGTTQYRNNLGELISVHTLEEAVHSADVEVDLQWLRPDDSRSNNWYPSLFAIRSTQETLKTLNGDDIILAVVIEGFDFMKQSSISHGLTLLWEGESSSTSLDVDYNYFDNKQRERSNADSRDLVYGLSHAVDIGNWSLEGRLGLSVNNDLDIVSRSSTELSEWGVSTAYNNGAGLDVSLEIDQSRNDYLDKVFGEDEVNNSRTYGVNMELGYWLAKYLGESVAPSLSLSWSRSSTDNRSEYYISDQRAESWLLNLGVQF